MVNIQVGDIKFEGLKEKITGKDWLNDQKPGIKDQFETLFRLSGAVLQKVYDLNYTQFMTFFAKFCEVYKLNLLEEVDFLEQK